MTDIETNKEDLDLRIIRVMEKKYKRKLTSDEKAQIRYMLDQDRDSLRAMLNIQKDTDLEKLK